MTSPPGGSRCSAPRGTGGQGSLARADRAREGGRPARVLRARRHHPYGDRLPAGDGRAWPGTPGPTASSSRTRWVRPHPARWVAGGAGARGDQRLPIEFHGHNDFGLVLANAVAAVEAGASDRRHHAERLGRPHRQPGHRGVGRPSWSCSTGTRSGSTWRRSRGCRGSWRPSWGCPSADQADHGALAFAHKLETHVKAVLTHPPPSSRTTPRSWAGPATWPSASTAGRRPSPPGWRTLGSRWARSPPGRLRGAGARERPGHQPGAKRRRPPPAGPAGRHRGRRQAARGVRDGSEPHRSLRTIILPEQAHRRRERRAPADMAAVVRGDNRVQAVVPRAALSGAAAQGRGGGGGPGPHPHARA